MFDLRGKFQKKLKSLGPRRNRKNEKKVDIYRGGYQILCQRKRRSKIRRKLTFDHTSYYNVRVFRF